MHDDVCDGCGGGGGVVSNRRRVRESSKRRVLARSKRLAAAGYEARRLQAVQRSRRVVNAPVDLSGSPPPRPTSDPPADAPR